MRPLVVLSLVIVAVLALLVALFTIAGSGSSSSDARSEAPEVAAADRETDLGEAPEAPSPMQAPEEAVRAVVEEGEEVELGTRVELGAAGAWANELAGEVVDPDGSPVSGASIELTRNLVPAQLRMIRQMMSTDESEEPTWETTSREDGSFSFRGLEPGDDYSLAAEHEDFARATLPIVSIPEEGTTRETLRMQTGYTVHGYVHDHTASPVADALVVIDLPFASALGAEARESPQHQEVVSDETGYYRIENVSPGTYNLTASAGGYGTRTKNNLLVQPKNEFVNHDFRLDPGCRIAGTVHDDQGRGIANAEVEALSYQTAQTSRGTALSNEHGDFLIEDLADGAYVLIVRAEGYGEERLNRVDCGNASVVVRMAEQATIRGVVVDSGDGSPVTDFKLKVRGVNPGSQVYGRPIRSETYHDREDGSYALRGVEPGQYVLEGESAGFAPTYSEPFEVARGIATPQVDVRLSRGGAIHGRVVDSRNGEGIKGAVVSTRDNHFTQNPFTEMLGGLMPRMTTQREVRTQKDGSFELELLTPDVTYQLEVEHTRFTATEVKDIRVHDGDPIELPPIEMRVGATIRGTVYDSNGLALPGAQVSVRAQVPARSYQARTGSDGRFVIRNVAAGTYDVSASRDGQGNPFDQILDMQRSKVTVTMIEGNEYSHDLYLGG